MANNVMLKLPVISQANLLHQLALSLGTVIPSYSTKPVSSALRINKRVATKTMSFFKKEEKKIGKTLLGKLPFFHFIAVILHSDFLGPYTVPKSPKPTLK